MNDQETRKRIYEDVQAFLDYLRAEGTLAVNDVETLTAKLYGIYHSEEAERGTGTAAHQEGLRAMTVILSHSGLEACDSRY